MNVKKLTFDLQLQIHGKLLKKDKPNGGNNNFCKLAETTPINKLFSHVTDLLLPINLVIVVEIKRK